MLGRIFVAFLTVTGVSRAAPPATPLVTQKLSDYRRIVLADKPKLVQKAAAEELARCVAKMTGKELAIVPHGRFDSQAAGLSFFLGDGVAKPLLGVELGAWKNEGYLLRSIPQGLLLAGDDGDGDAWSATTRAGTMLAVYTLLDDHLGCRWFWPGPFGEHVPIDPNAAIPALNVRAVPKLLIRSMTAGYSSYHTKEYREAYRKWFRRSRMAWTRSAVFGHSWYNAFHLKTGEDFKTHPDWFALVKGHRQPPQMCTTHPEVLDRMVERVLASPLDITNISPSDGGGFCECNEETKSAAHKARNVPSCTSYDIPGLLAYDNKHPQISDRIFTYANEVARRVSEKAPEKGVGMFAYTYYNRPPRNINRLEPNLYLSFVYQAASHRDPAARAEWEESVAGWKKLGAKLVMREGWDNHYPLSLPWPHYDQLLTNFPRAYQLGFQAAYGDGGKNFSNQAPTLWVVTRMMWDPERDTTRLMDDFYRSAYGPVAEEMRAFFETYNQALDANWAKRRKVVDTTGVAYANMISSWHLLYPKAVVARAEARLKAAEAKVPKGEYTDRVAFHRVGQNYTAVMLELLDTYRLLSEIGVQLTFSTPAVKRAAAPGERDRLLKQAFELGEVRERMLLAHRDWAALDEGLLAFANDKGLRGWHTIVKKMLGIDKPSAVTGKALER